MTTSQPTPESFFDCLREACPLAIEARDGGIRRLTFEAGPGLFQFSVVMDAAEMDWERLYVNLELFHNNGARTGPWDFDIVHQNAPLVPSYWAALDGRKLGLWYMQRVSIEDITARRFRGRMAFHVPAAGPHVLELTPYSPEPVRWISARLETDPEDALDPREFDLAGWDRRCPAARWAAPSYWADLKQKLDTTHAVYREPLARLFAYLRRKPLPESKRNAPPTTWGFASDLPAYHPEDILLLLAEHYLTGRPESMDDALRAVDAAVALPHWGNPREGAYGCDGDMGAAHMLRALSWAWHALREHLGPERRERLREKLRLQGARFFDQCLLHRDYWGGSVMQDHGKISLASFGAAAIHLLGVVPEAGVWTAYAVPRVGRSLDAIPTDGHIPPSSYGSPILFLDNPTYYRDALLALTGEDIFDRAPFRAVVDFMVEQAREGDDADLVRRHGRSLLVGGTHFLNYMAAKYGDGRAAWLQLRHLDMPEFKFGHGTQENGYYHGLLWGFLTYAPAVEPVAPPRRGTMLRRFEDSGVVHYRDAVADATLDLQCGPWCGYNAYRRARGPCDRMEMLGGSGHFTVALRGQPVIVAPDAGYRLRYHTRNVMLVDDGGPKGDIGYPMSIPSFRDRGEEIEYARWDEERRNGSIRLDLLPAYRSDLGMAIYTREFLLEEGRGLVVRDHVVFSRPHRLAWHFHGVREAGLAVGGLECRFGPDPAVRLEARPVSGMLRASVQPTEVVYAYSSAFGAFDHVRFETPEPAATLLVDFVITWPGFRA